MKSVFSILMICISMLRLSAQSNVSARLSEQPVPASKMSPLRIALMDFVSDDNSYRSALIKYLARYINTAKAQFYAGEVFYQGKLVEKDAAQAADWFGKAAKDGSPEAMNRIGEMWAGGMNGVPDLKEAANWYRRAADKGLPEAQYRLGLCYVIGEGVTANPVEAWRWLDLAANQKFPNATEARDNIQATMTADQIKDARNLAKSAGTR